MPQPLCPSDILAYGEKLGFKADLIFFVRVVGELDDYYMQEVAKKAKAEANKSKNKSKRKRN